jgi:hypothetical protein
VVTKLKAIYYLIEKLYAGSLRTLVAVSNGRKPSPLMKTVLYQLSTIPKQVEELKLSATRSGAITALSRAKAYQSELDPTEMAGGCPEYNDDGQFFKEADFARCVKEMWPLACQLAQELDLTKYQPAYDSNNTRIKPPSFDIVDLTPQRRKHIFASDIDPSLALNDEATFEALTGIDWTSDNLQIASNEEPARDNPEASTARCQDDVNPAGHNLDGSKAGSKE